MRFADPVISDLNDQLVSILRKWRSRVVELTGGDGVEEFTSNAIAIVLDLVRKEETRATASSVVRREAERLPDGVESLVARRARATGAFPRGTAVSPAIVTVALPELLDHDRIARLIGAMRIPAEDILLEIMQEGLSVIEAKHGIKSS
jgi:hypothetical protein